MIDFPYIADMCRRTDSKIVMLVVDGLGGAPHPETGLSELETASLPNLDRLAQESAAGMTTPVAPGVTPGSGPGHMALFGYDPVKYLMGRGVLEALGIGVQLRRRRRSSTRQPVHGGRRRAARGPQGRADTE